MRPEVKAFALMMEEQLAENDHKGSWSGMRRRELFSRLDEETQELKEAVYHSSPASIKNITKEAADVANFAMMIADRYGDLMAATEANGFTTCSCCEGSSYHFSETYGRFPCYPCDGTGKMVEPEAVPKGG